MLLSRSVFRNLLVLSLVFVLGACQAKALLLELTLTSVPEITPSPLLASPSPIPTTAAFPITGVFPEEKSQKESSCPPDGWTSYTTENGLVDNWASALTIDAGGKVWVGFSNGRVNFLRDGIWLTLISSPESPIGKVNVILPLPDNTVWIGTQNGEIGYLGGDGWKTWSLSDVSTGSAVYDLIILPDGKILAGTWMGLAQLSGINWTMVNSPFGDQRQFTVYTIHYVEEENGFWVGAKPGLYYLQGNIWGSISVPDVNLQGVNSIEPDNSGNYWFLTAHNLVRYDGSKWIDIPSISSLQFDWVTAMAIDSQERIWVGSAQGVAVYEDEEWDLLSVEDGLIDARVYHIEIDPWGAVWFSTQEGISCFNP